MSFGLCNGPASVQHDININMSSVRFKSIMVYLDDNILFPNNADEHLENIENVMSLLQNAGLTVKQKKWFFIHESMEYLGHIVKPKKLYIVPKRTDALQQM